MASRHGRWDSTDSNCPTVRSSSSKDDLEISWGIFPWEFLGKIHGKSMEKNFLELFWRWEKIMVIALKIIETWNAKPHETSDMSDIFLWPDLFSRYRVVLIHIRPTTNPPGPHCWHTSLPKRSASRWRSNSSKAVLKKRCSDIRRWLSNRNLLSHDGGKRCLRKRHARHGWKRPKSPVGKIYIQCIYIYYILSDMDKVKYGKRFSKTWSNS